MHHILTASNFLSELPPEEIHNVGLIVDNQN